MSSDSDVAFDSFLEHLKSLYPASSSNSGTPTEVITNPWYVVAAVTFASCNRPEAVPLVFLHALGDLKKVQEKEGTGEKTAQKEGRQLARRLRESLLKSCLLCGAPRAINGMIALHEAMPEELRDKKMLRKPFATIEEFDCFGGMVFRTMYGDTTDEVQGLFDKINPDFGWISRVVGCGMFFGQTDVLSPVETSYVMVAAIYGMETSRQFNWHLTNARRAGASLEEARAVRQICMEVGQRAGFKWKEAVPDVE